MTNDDTMASAEPVSTDLASMSHAIHEVYCGTTPDHDGPNAKVLIQAWAILAALRRETTTL
jgi:hypothetical protein